MTANHTDDAHGRDEQSTDRSGADQSRRRFLKGTAASVAGLVALGTASGSASAASNKRLLVVGNGSGGHSYTVQMESGGQISRAIHAGGNDTETTNSAGNERIEGNVWHWNVDSYTYSGSIDYVEGDGSLSFHFLDGSFRDESRLSVTGNDSGRHDYTIGINHGDIDPDPAHTGFRDTDEGDASSENNWTADYVTGVAWSSGTDEYTLGYRDSVQCISIDDGHLTIE